MSRVQSYLPFQAIPSRPKPPKMSHPHIPQPRFGDVHPPDAEKLAKPMGRRSLLLPDESVVKKILRVLNQSPQVQAKLKEGETLVPEDVPKLQWGDPRAEAQVTRGMDQRMRQYGTAQFMEALRDDSRIHAQADNSASVSDGFDPNLMVRVKGNDVPVWRVIYTPARFQVLVDNPKAQANWKPNTLQSLANLLQGALQKHGYVDVIEASSDLKTRKKQLAAMAGDGKFHARETKGNPGCCGKACSGCFKGGGLSIYG